MKSLVFHFCFFFHGGYCCIYLWPCLVLSADSGSGSSSESESDGDKASSLANKSKVFDGSNLLIFFWVIPIVI